MADTTKKIVIIVDGDQAKKELQDIAEALAKTTQETEKLDKAQDNAANTSKKSGGAFASLGAIIKGGLGIGLVIEVLGKMKEMLMGNEVVASKVETAMNFLQLVMNQIVNVVVKVGEKLSDLWGSMDHTKAVISDVMTMALTPMKLAFYGIALGVNEVQLAWEKSMFGKKDANRIKELTDNVEEYKKKFVETSKDAGKAVVDWAKNIGGALVEVGNATIEGGKVLVEESKKIDLQKTLDRAKQLHEMEEGLKREALALQEQLNMLKEQQQDEMQLRNDRTLSIAERKQHAEEVLRIIEAEKQKSLELAAVHLQEAKNAYELKNTKENLTAVIAAGIEVSAVEAEYSRIKTRQIKQDIQLEIEEAALQGKLNQERWDAQKKSEAADVAAIVSTNDRIKAQKEMLAQQLKIDIMMQESIANNMSLEEAARREAKNQLIILQSSYNDAIKKLDLDLHKYQIENSIKTLDLISTNEMSSYDTRKQAYKDLLDANKNNDLIDDAEREKRRLDLNQKLKDLALAEKIQKLQIAQQGIDALRSMDQAATQVAIDLQNQKLKNGKITQEEYDKNVAKIQEQAAKREKAYAIGSAIISGAQAVLNALATKAPWPIPVVMAALAGVLAAAQVAKIIATPIQSTGAGSSASSGSVSAPSTAPNTSFSFAPTTTSETTTAPIKTYVLTKDVQSAQQMDRAVVANGSI